MMEELLEELRRLDVRLHLDGDALRVVAPPGRLNEALRSALRQHRSELVHLLRAADEPEAVPVLQHDAAGRWLPFPLTQLQHAYWLGRDKHVEMGGVAAHLYVELACPALDLARANQALVQLIDLHDMLRAVVDADGRQRVLPSVPAYRISVFDACDLGNAAAEAAVRAGRNAWSHEVRSPGHWPLFEVRATALPGGWTRLHISLDLLLFDAWSLSQFFRDWHALYLGEPVAAPSVGYRDYVLAQAMQADSARHRAAQAYWEARIDSLPPPPELPLRPLPAGEKPRFVRREMRLPAARWQALRERARARELRPAALLLAAFADVLARWSVAPHFSIVVTGGHREPWHADVPRILGNFTSVLLHEIDRRPAAQDLAAFAASVQQRLAQDFEHVAYSGVAVRREWARRRGVALDAVMPVVFSSGLAREGEHEIGDLEQFGHKVFSISQTSQVWLDHHVTEQRGELVLEWDAVEAVFQPGVLDAMFASYCDLIERLADDPSAWMAAEGARLPAPMQQRRDEAEHTAVSLPLQPLHAPLAQQARLRGEAAAVIAADRTLSHAELHDEAAAVAQWLLHNGVKPGEPVALVMRKGWEQVVAVVGTLMAGGAYVPIDADLPIARQLQLLQQCAARHVLTQPGAWRGGAGEGTLQWRELHAGARVSRDGAGPTSDDLNRLAYVIFTSGTTGVPKGVMIDHRGASNTVLALNRMLDVTAQDRVLGVSSLSFDLSVYDIFGVLGAGGAIVLPDPRRGHDPQHWAELIRTHRVTLWNSAPQLMRMLVDGLEPGTPVPALLRAVLLSGDFIALDLPARLRDRGCTARLHSLGGATEASIWSIHHPIEAVDPAWASIPYGRALPNQTVHVLDEALRPVPDHVRGRIHIGGAGLARGYLGDEALTARRFIVHPRTGERLYDTGDLGRYLEDGSIAILGRDDGQIKVRGHRVELGEIESVLCRHPDVAQALVVAHAGVADTRRLLAYVRPPPGANAPHPDALLAHVAQQLPDYMVPHELVLLPQLPLSANGKIDHQALPDIAAPQPARQRVAPRNRIEQQMLAVWQAVMPGVDIGVTDNFFDLGGDSVLATSLMLGLNEALPARIEMHELFENFSIEALAELVQRRGAGQPGATVCAPAEVLADDVAAARAMLTQWSLPTDSPATPACVLLTGATGWVGAHMLAELLHSTRSEVVCLVRAGNDERARERLRIHLRALDLEPTGAQWRRVRVLAGRLDAPRLGLTPAAWQTLSQQVGSVFHLGASVSLAQSYNELRGHNVLPLHELLRLASTARRKALYTLSPTAVCRRRVDGALRVLDDERVHEHADGLPTAYAQSKWVGEQILWAATQRGLPVRIYRSSHALPPSAGGAVKPNDTYLAALSLAARVDVLPDWPEACVQGLPVDALCRCWLQDALNAPMQSAVVHLEPRPAPRLADVLAAVPGGRGWAKVAFEQWQQRCLQASHELPGEQGGLARMLFEPRAGGAAIETMFGASAFSTRHFESLGWQDRLSGLTPPPYWKRCLT